MYAGHFRLLSAGCPNERDQAVDFIRYVTGLAVFVLTSMALVLPLHLLALWHAKRKGALSAGRTK